MRVVETDQRVGEPVCVTRWRWWAEHELRRYRTGVIFPSYRYELIRDDGRWKVQAMQNVAAS